MLDPARARETTLYIPSTNPKLSTTKYSHTRHLIISLPDQEALDLPSSRPEPLWRSSVQRCALSIPVCSVLVHCVSPPADLDLGNAKHEEDEQCRKGSTDIERSGENVVVLLVSARTTPSMCSKSRDHLRQRIQITTHFRPPGELSPPDPELEDETGH